MGKMIVLIPAYEPGERMLQLLEALLPQESGSPACIDGIIVVDDGSGEKYQPLFQRAKALGCLVVRHAENRGKGAAIRTGIQAVADRYGGEVDIVTADADGQHLPGDILRVAAALRGQGAGYSSAIRTGQALPVDRNAAPGADAAGAGNSISAPSGAPSPNEKPVLVLGVRDFSGENVPLRSRLGNRFSSLAFRLAAGTDCGDTQTGLRGIPAALLPLALSTEGSRYEYEMFFLLEAARQARLVQIPIETVYEDGNSTSHFRPVRDSLLIFQRPLRFCLTAGASACVDWILFLGLMRLFGSSVLSARGIAVAEDAAAASAISRIGSGMVNFTLNRRWSFQSRGGIGGDAARYLLLFTANLLCNAGAVAGLAYLGVPAAAGKFLVDIALFLANYQVQKRWVFR